MEYPQAKPKKLPKKAWHGITFMLQYL